MSPRSRDRRRKRPKQLHPPASVLVASFLVVQAPPSVFGAPQPLHTNWTPSPREASFSDVISLEHTSRKSTYGREYDDVDDIVPMDDTRHHVIDEFFGDNRPTPTVAKRVASTYPITTATGKAIAVPPSFASNIASSWDPGRRSVWFQRKAVIITSIFLAIFIVLIIGCTVFLRDKRDEDLDEEYDASDEAAIERMREERRMRQGKSSEKKRSRKRKDLVKEDTASSTPIVASKWTRISTRKIRLRKKTSSKTSSGQASIHSQSNPEQRRVEESDRASVHTSNEHSLPTREVNTSQSSSSRSPRGDAPHQGHDLSPRDIEAAEARHQTDTDTDMLPPAYIASHQRDEVVQSNPQRRLAGQESMSNSVTDAKSRLPNDTTLQATQLDPRTTEPAPYAPAGTFDAPRGIGYGQNASATSDSRFSGHLATDEKSILSQMRAAASQPDAAPQYVPSQSSGSVSAPQASAPQIDEEDEGLPASLVEGKGKNIPLSEGSSRLLPPPSAPPTVAFSRFDMPYETERRDNDRTSSSNKAVEAEAEQRHAMALLASQPDDARDLPRYEREMQHTAAPSAPPALDDPLSQDDSLVEQGVSAHTPSTPVATAPPLDDPEDSSDHTGN